MTKEAAAPFLEIKLLGDFTVTLDGRLLNTLNSNRLQSLFVYLLLHRHAPQPRQHIAFLFWPDSTEKQALSNLRTIYHRLLQKLPQAELFLQSDRQMLQWRPGAPFTLDVAEFETAVHTAQSAAEWQTAADLYPGPLLPGWYAEWLEPDRQRLQQLFLQAGETLLQLLEELRSYPAAIKTAHFLLQNDPLHEPTYRSLMRLQALSGGKADALRTYHTCATLLEQELGVSPAQATQDLYEQLLHAGLELAPGPTSEPQITVTPLIGRDQEWQTVQQAWQTAERGRTLLVLISGEAGTGKSRLAAELLLWAQRQGIAAVSTRSYEAEGELAYAPLLGWLRSPVLQAACKKLDDMTLTELARLLPELLVERLDLPAPAPLTQSWRRQRLFQALARAVFAYGRPLLLHIDDLQWCDQDTLEWLHFLLRFSPRLPLLLVGAYRPEEIDDRHPLSALQLALRRVRQLTELELPPLSESVTSELAAKLAGRELEAGEAARLYQETEGNPLFILEMVQAGLGEQSAIPRTVQAMIQARLARVSFEARELLAQAAVIGRAFDYDLLARSSGMGEEILVTRLDELWRRRIIREHGRAGYDFSHDKFREVAYAQLSATRRRLLHRRVAQALETRHSSHIEAYSAQIAAHYELAGLPREAIPHYQLAAAAAHKLYADAEALSFIRRGLGLLPALPPDTDPAWRWAAEAHLYETLGDLLHFAAHYQEALEAYETAFAAVNQTAASNPIRLCRLKRKAGSSCLPQYQYEAALHYYDLGREALGPKPTAEENSWWREWIELQQERKYVNYWLNRWPVIGAIIEESRPILAQFGTAEQQANFFDPSMFYRRDRFVISDEVLSYVREYHAANMALNDAVRQAAAHFSLGFTLLWYGDLAEAEQSIRTALAMTYQSGDVNLRARCLNYLTIVARKQERLPEVRALAAQSALAAEEAQMLEYTATARANQSWLAWRAGEDQEAKDHGRAALEMWATLPKGHASCAFQWTALFPLLAVAVKEGDLEQAGFIMQALLDPTQQALPGELTAVLQQSATAIQEKRRSESASRLVQAVTLAQKMLYL